MKRKLVITLDEQATAKYLKLARSKTNAELEAVCLPSGVDLTIGLGLLGWVAYCDSDELGDVTVEIVEAP